MKKLSKYISLFLICTFLFTTFPIAHAEQKLFEIHNVDDFIKFSENCTSDVWSVGLTAELKTDLDLTNTNFIPIPIFQGTFHGNNHTVKGLMLKQNGAKIGLFRILTETAIIENLYLDASLEIGGTACSIGIIVGENNGTIRNCTVKGTLDGIENIGGITGINEKTGQIENCTSAAKISGTKSVGGIAGRNLGTIIKCTNRGDVNTDDKQKVPFHIGGITGNSLGLVQESENHGKIGYPHLGYNIGGIVGLQIGETRNCTNFSIINGRKDVGGCIGQLEPITEIQELPSSLEILNNNVSFLLSHGKNLTNYLGHIANGGATYAKDIQNIMLEINQRISSDSNTFHSDLKELNKIISNKPSLNVLIKNLNHYTNLWSNRTKSLINDLDLKFNTLEKKLSQISKDLDKDNQKLQALSNEMSQSLEKTKNSLHSLSKKPELTITDQSALITDGNGVISGCNDTGDVAGDFNVGGIVGSISVEVQSDPEATLEIEKPELFSDTNINLQAVILDCDFSGNVNVKNDYGGGIVGRGEIGAILDSTSNGLINVGTNYCGGIAGKMQGNILRCSVLIDLEGKSWIGGITGYGKDISDSNAMVQIDGSGEYQGAIAGQADGQLVHNFYLKENLAGLDGIDYVDKAQGLGWNDFSKLETIPQNFLSFSYTFKANGQIIAKIPFKYGEDLDEKLIPPLPVLKDQCGSWPKFPTKNLKRSLILDAHFESPRTTISSGGNHPALLAEGIFALDASIVLNESKNNLPQTDFGKSIKTLSYEIIGNKDKNTILRVYTADIKNPSIFLLKDGTWNKINFTQNGSYIIFTAPEKGELLLTNNTTDYSKYILIFSIGILVIILIITLCIFKKKKKKQNKKI